jgi:hypothetical protein
MPYHRQHKHLDAQLYTSARGMGLYAYTQTALNDTISALPAGGIECSGPQVEHSSDSSSVCC